MMWQRKTARKKNAHDSRTSAVTDHGAGDQETKDEAYLNELLAQALCEE
eukprot:CAMPEP_0177413050 /NCGR_PEP_ID=MMETSP0368-20130122/66305_1 /TAXON_ID=447022 ORGANISM="Scrippsiella hangoei-like, Strain SHHI-4" /NCGR_SAMPLE_ID=MMETSP0368 /ASSEMBLY_ACC=CAM_ASM_000363 /LENGTH=48 /DNA_ID= /DNA_START= /DNA_END= /DNA_ORIENTATION=